MTIRLAVLSMLFLVVNCTYKKEQPQERQSSAPPASSELPMVTLVPEKGQPFSARTLSGKTILIFFGATCDHCQREATQIRDHLKDFDTYTVYFVAMDPFPVIYQFAQQYGLAGQPNFRFLRADGASVDRSLGYLKTPTIIVYDEHGKLVKRFDGETPIQEILSVL